MLTACKMLKSLTVAFVQQSGENITLGKTGRAPRPSLEDLTHF
jgi:hypothetical protein